MTSKKVFTITIESDLSEFDLMCEVNSFLNYIKQDERNIKSYIIYSETSKKEYVRNGT